MVPKRAGDWHSILDLDSLNNSPDTTVQPEDFLPSIDLAEASFRIPVRPGDYTLQTELTAFRSPH